MEKRLQILRWLVQREGGGEGPPSVREVAEGVGLSSTQTAHKHLKRLEAAGYTEREGRKARGVRLTERGWEAAGEMPMLGRIAAGPGDGGRSGRRICFAGLGSVRSGTLSSRGEGAVHERGGHRGRGFAARGG